MKRYDAGRSGGEYSGGPSTDELDVGADWREFIRACINGHTLLPVQAKALIDARMLETRRHLVVSAPTNSGKSMIGYLALAEALKAGYRAVLLEPLRSLAQEKADDLKTLMKSVGLKTVPRVLLSTGDYRLEHETFEDAPPPGGEVIVATPERLDAILRSPENNDWVNSVGCVVVDEAHLIGTRHRGPTLELLIANLLSGVCPPRLVLLSATTGEPEHLQSWLEPCDLVEEKQRTPALSVEVWGLEEDENIDDLLCEDIARVLEDEKESALVFVYQRASVERLALKLKGHLCQQVLAYHSGLSVSTRHQARTRFVDGRARVVVATTALALGVNLPATHVYIRDTTFFGHGRVGVDELLQMAGRAGRGTRDGRAVVLVRPNDNWSSEELAQALRNQDLPPLRSTFEKLGLRLHKTEMDLEPAAQLVATCLSRTSEAGIITDDLRRLLERTLAGKSLGKLVEPSITWLEDPTRVLAFCGEDQHHRLTVLGRRGVRAVLPLSFVAGFGQLFRDLLWIDSHDGLIDQWTSLDHLLVMCLLSDRHPKLRRFSEKLSGQIDGWHESRSQTGKSLLFRRWVSGTASASSADELCGSLGMSHQLNGSQEARKRGYLAMLGAIVLEERSRGGAVTDLERRWGVKSLDGVEESWRDTALWLLAGQARLCELRCFYHHLIDHCQAGPERIQRVKRILGTLRHQCFDLIEGLKYCSPLGPLMRGVRGMQKHSSGAVVGAGTLRRIEEAGVTSLRQLAEMKVDHLVELGVQKRFAKQIRAYLQRRLR